MKNKKKKASSSDEQWDRLVSVSSSRLRDDQMAGMPSPGPSAPVFVRPEVRGPDEERFGIAEILASIASEEHNKPTQFQHGGPNQTFSHSHSSQQGRTKQERPADPAAMAMGSAVSTLLVTKSQAIPHLPMLNGANLPSPPLQNGHVPPPREPECGCREITSIMLTMLDRYNTFPYRATPLLEHLLLFKPYVTGMCSHHMQRYTSISVAFLLEEAARASQAALHNPAVPSATIADRTASVPSPRADGQPPLKRLRVDGPSCPASYYDCAVDCTPDSHCQRLDHSWQLHNAEQPRPCQKVDNHTDVSALAGKAKPAEGWSNGNARAPVQEPAAAQSQEASGAQRADQVPVPVQGRRLEHSVTQPSGQHPTAESTQRIYDAQVRNSITVQSPMRAPPAAQGQSVDQGVEPDPPQQPGQPQGPSFAHRPEHMQDIAPLGHEQRPDLAQRPHDGQAFPPGYAPRPGPSHNFDPSHGLGFGQLPEPGYHPELGQSRGPATGFGMVNGPENGWRRDHFQHPEHPQHIVHAQHPSHAQGSQNPQHHGHGQRPECPDKSQRLDVGQMPQPAQKIEHVQSPAFPPHLAPARHSDHSNHMQPPRHMEHPRHADDTIHVGHPRHIDNARHQIPLQRVRPAHAQYGYAPMTVVPYGKAPRLDYPPQLQHGPLPDHRPMPDQAPKLDKAHDNQYRLRVMEELHAKPTLAKGKSHGDVTGRLMLKLLELSQSPDDSEAYVLSGQEAAAKMEAGPPDCPIFTEGQQLFTWTPDRRPIEQMFRRMENLNRSVSVQVPSRKSYNRSFQKQKLSEIKERFLQSGGANEDPWNILDLSNPLPPTTMPKFLAGENCQLLLRVRDAVLGGSSGERTAAAKEKWNEWLNVLDWVLLSEGGHNTAPHTDSHGLSTWITVQEGLFGFGWLSKPTKEERAAWITNPQEFTEGRWRFTVLTPGKTVFFPSGTIHFVFRLQHGQTLALGGHLLQWNGIERWMTIVREQMGNPQITNEDVEWSAPKYVHVIAELIRSRVTNGRVDEVGGQEVVDRFFKHVEEFDKERKEAKPLEKSPSKKKRKR